MPTEISDRCPTCHGSLPAGTLPVQCPSCSARIAPDSDTIDLARGEDLGNTIAMPTSQGVLETLAATIGHIPRLSLHDTEAAHSLPATPRLSPPTESASRFRLLGEIARGGMGAVLKGRDEDLGRDLAIKVLLEKHRDNPDLTRRFVEEAQIGGQLQHPGIVPVYELGTLADRRPYFAMKLVKGRTLAALLADRSSPADSLSHYLGIFEHVCQTVAYAHAREVIHRDLKPSNVMVGSFGEVQVMDWGLAKVLAREEAETAPIREDTVVATDRAQGDSDLSRAGSAMGTPAYMAPEQARGEIDRIGKRADVFSLGSILCEILTGRPAFTGQTSGEIHAKAARGDAAEALRRLDACGADEELIALARGCLAPEPEGRPADASAVAEGIAAYRAGVEERLRRAELDRVEARAVEERRKRIWQLWLVGTAAALMMTAATAISVVSAQSRFHLDQKNRDLAEAYTELERQHKRAEDRELQAIDAVKRFKDTVADNDELKNNPALESLRKALLKEPLAYFDSLRERLQADRDTRAESLVKLSDAIFEFARLSDEIGDKGDALRAAGEALVIRRDLARGNPDLASYQVKLGESLQQNGSLLQDACRVDEAMRHYQSARALFQDLARQQPSQPAAQAQLANIHNSIGNLLRVDGRAVEALQTYEIARGIRTKLASDQPTSAEYQIQLADSLHNIGYLLQTGSGSIPEVPPVPDGLEVPPIPPNTPGVERPALVGSRERGNRADGVEKAPGMAGGVAAVGRSAIRQAPAAPQPIAMPPRPDEALATYKLSLDIYERLTHQYPDKSRYQAGLANSHNSMGILFEQTGQADQAIRSFQTAVNIRNRLVKDHPAITEFQRALAGSQLNLGNALRGTGRMAEALSSLQSARDLFGKLALDNPGVYEFQISLAEGDDSIGRLFLTSGHLSDALLAFNSARDLRAKLGPSQAAAMGDSTDDMVGGIASRLGVNFKGFGAPIIGD